jgi:hypothetical protein
VRSAEQQATLVGLGAEHVVDSSLPDFTDQLAAAVAATGATLAFDAIGGGALVGGAMWSDYRLVDAAAVVELPDDVTTAEAAAFFVNPMTALSMVATMRAENHSALVHTAAASNLGQMLVKICQDDGVGLVNIVRSAEQQATLAGLGAEHVVDSSLPDFADRLAEAVAAPGATLAFDAIGGGALVGDILAAMEAAADRPDPWTPYGSTTHKQVYIYGSLDHSPTTILRTFGMRWGVGGYLLTDALARLGYETVVSMRSRVLAEIKTTFASSYAQTIGLTDVLDLDNLAAFAKRSTGTKYLIDPSRDRR